MVKKKTMNLIILAAGLGGLVLLASFLTRKRGTEAAFPQFLPGEGGGAGAGFDQEEFFRRLAAVKFTAGPAVSKEAEFVREDPVVTQEKFIPDPTLTGLGLPTGPGPFITPQLPRAAGGPLFERVIRMDPREVVTTPGLGVRLIEERVMAEPTPQLPRMEIANILRPIFTILTGIGPGGIIE